MLISCLEKYWVGFIICMWIYIYFNDVEIVYFNIYKIVFNKDRFLYLFNIKNWFILGFYFIFVRCIE